MTENKFETLKDAICELVNLAEDATSREVFEMLDNAGADVIDCLDKLSGFEAIGTIDEFKALKEKSVAKKPIDKIMYLECPACGDVGILDCGYCSVCGQKLDRSE